MGRVELALYRPHKITDLGGRLICWWTESDYSHVEIVIDGWCYSSSLRDGGVRKKRIDLLPSWWGVVDLPGADAEKALSLYARTAGQRYGWTDLFTQHVMRFPREDAGGWVCSEWVAMALGLARPQTWTPGMLADYARGF